MQLAIIGSSRSPGKTTMTCRASPLPPETRPGSGRKSRSRPRSTRGCARCCRPLLVGDPAAVEMHAKAAGLTPRLNVVAKAGDADWSDGAVNLLDAGDGTNVPVRFGKVDAAYGRASLASRAPRHQAALAGEVEAVVAAPQTERSIAAAGIAFDGYPSFVARETRHAGQRRLSDDLLRRQAHRARHAACERARGDGADHAGARRARDPRHRRVAQEARDRQAEDFRRRAQSACRRRGHVRLAKRSISSSRRSRAPRNPASTCPARSAPTPCSAKKAATPIS